MRLLDIIADSPNLEVLTGDINNAFIQTHTKEKINTKCGPELFDKSRSFVITLRALYSLTSSAERFKTILAEFYAPLILLPVLTEISGCNYMMKNQVMSTYTHVDYFKIIAKNPCI